MKKTLYFIDGFAPSADDLKKASKIEGRVEFRNVQLFDPEQPLEKCTGVAGMVPQPYVEAHDKKEEKDNKK